MEFILSLVSLLATQGPSSGPAPTSDPIKPITDMADSIQTILGLLTSVGVAGFVGVKAKRLKLFMFDGYPSRSAHFASEILEMVTNEQKMKKVAQQVRDNGFLDEALQVEDESSELKKAAVKALVLEIRRVKWRPETGFDKTFSWLPILGFICAFIGSFLHYWWMIVIGVILMLCIFALYSNLSTFPAARKI